MFEMVKYLYLLVYCVNVSSIRFHHVHSPLHDFCSSLPEHNSMFGSFLAPRLAQRPRQPPSSLNGSTDPGCYQTGRLQKLDFPLPNVVPTAVKAGKRQFRAS